MEGIVKGKFCRTDTVVGVCFSPVIENFFEEIGDGVDQEPLMPNGTELLHQASRDTLRDFSIVGRPHHKLRDRDGRPNLHFLRAQSLSQNDAEFDADLAISKWYPSSSDKREEWLDFVESRGFERENPPKPPGVLIDGCDAKYSNSALEDVMRSVKEVAHKIQKEYIQPTEFEFTV